MTPAAPFDAQSHLIERPRVEKRLIARFEARLTTVVAPAGAGKTSALALAIEHNRLDPRGIDIYVPLSGSIVSARGLDTTILRHANHPVSGEESDAELRQSVIDLVWAAAPDDLVLVLDDVHLLDGPDVVSELRALLDELPTNGHVVLTSRHTIPIPLARLRAHRRLVEITSVELELDDHELRELQAARAVTGATDLPRHAATADLRLAAGAGASTDFLREEVLAGLQPDRLSELQRLSVLDDAFDEAFVDSFTDGRYDANDLLDALPLVERRADHTFRLHALLREALARDHLPTERRKAAAMAADLLHRHGNHVASIRLYLDAGDEIGARDVARAFISAPTMNQSSPDIAEITRLIETIDDDSPLLEILQITRRFIGLEPGLSDQMEAAAGRARNHGDAALEALALHRAFQARFFNLDFDDVEGPALDRLRELATTLPFARGALAHVNSQAAQIAGDVVTGLACLEEYVHLGDASQIVAVSQRLIDLGYPDRVGEGLTPDLLANLPDGSEVFVAYAMWLRGEESPEFAHEFVTAMLDDIERRGVRDTVVSMLGVATSIALAAGDDERARRHASHAADLVRLGTPAMAATFASVATASVAAVVESDEAAADLLAAEVTGHRLDAWPTRGQLLAMPLLYATRPETRPVIDRMVVGPALSNAIAAGRALVALRSGDPEPAASLPWSQLHILRVHVLPHHLVELACAAMLAGAPGASDALAHVPHVDRHLGRVVAERRSVASQHAQHLLGRRQAVAPHRIELDLLGPIELRRDGDVVRDDDWVRRVRVRELLAVLSERRRLSRPDLLGAMWTEHDDDTRADANLRSTLSRLQRVLEPERTDTEPYFLRSDADVLTLHPDLTTDVGRFEQLIDQARRDDEAGLPARALDGYRTALDLYRGDFVLGLDVGWAVLTRMRLRALAVGAMCRIGELVAARGEPEVAARWAQNALDIDDVSERAAVVFVSALGASGERSVAREAAEMFTTRFADRGLELDRATRRQLDRWR